MGHNPYERTGWTVSQNISAYESGMLGTFFNMYGGYLLDDYVASDPIVGYDAARDDQSGIKNVVKEGGEPL